MNVKDLIELLRALPKGSKIVLQRKEFDLLFRDLNSQQRAEKIARLNNCTLTFDESSGVATFTRFASVAPAELWGKSPGPVNQSPRGSWGMEGPGHKHGKAWAALMFQTTSN